MNNLQQVMKEAREALENATPGPWSFAVMEDSRHVIYDHTYFNRHIAEIVRGGVESEQREEDNADLIANAPTWLSTLLSAYEEAQREIAELKTELSETQMMCHNFQRMANGYFAELQELRYPSTISPSKEEQTLCDQCDGSGAIWWEEGGDIKGGRCPFCNKEESK